MQQLKPKLLDAVIIRFSGDSGDGIQISGGQFTETAALVGNDIHTFPDYPAEIRAPTGTLPGVSGFQLHFASQEIHTPGDAVDVLVAMNPAALKANLKDLKPGGIIIANENAFETKDLTKVGYQANPLEDGSLNAYQVYPMPMTTLTVKAVEPAGVSFSQAKKCKNMFALGVVFWLYSRPLEHTLAWLSNKFKKDASVAQANQAALQAGYNFALTTEIFTEQYQVEKAKLAPGLYRQISGNEAIALGCVAAASLANTPLLMASYPITPASSILQQLTQYSHHNIKTLQAEDEIAAICAAVGAAFGGHLAVTATSGPGMDLKSEGLSLAVMTELPLVVIDVQRAGPSTGMPTKTEQADLLLAMYGRHGECPVPILALQSPGDGFYIMIEAFRMAIQFMTPVIVLSDGYLASGAEPWQIPQLADLPDLTPHYAKPGPDQFSPYQRNHETLARPWAIPGTQGLEHRLGGLEKDYHTGNISYDPDNHAKMVAIRAQKVQLIQQIIPPAEVMGPEAGELLVISWGSTHGSVLSAVRSLQAAGHSIAMLHLRHLNPWPANLGEIIASYRQVVVAELNLGQLAKLLRSEFLVDIKSVTKVTGKPFLIHELKSQFLAVLQSETVV